MAYAETTSDGEVGYKTARSGAASDDSLAGEGMEAEELPDESTEPRSPIDIGAIEGRLRKKTARDAPAPVAPIGKLPRIPSMEPLNTHSQSTTPPEAKKVPIYEICKDHLVGKTIDEWGDIVDGDGTVLGRVEGDLPSMVGRKISNARGDVLGDDGGLLGFVAEVGPAGNRQNVEVQQEVPKEQVPTRSLDEVMKDMAAAGKGPGGLRVDPFGNILDAQGNLVGSFHDKNTGFGRRSGAFPDSDLSENANESKPRTKSRSHKRAQEDKPTPAPGKLESTATERRDQAQAQKTKENPLNPSDIFLDVKSTTEGIQLTIRIPTVFSSAGQPLKPKIVFE